MDVSSIPGVSDGGVGDQVSMAVAVKAQQVAKDQGAAVLALLESATQTAAQVNAPAAPVPELAHLGQQVDVKA